MARKPRPPAGSQFRRDAKLDDGALIRLAFAFCTGAPVERAAERGGVPAKTARAIYRRLRARLAQPKFNRWHAGYQKLVTETSADREFLTREAFDTLAGSYRNFPRQPQNPGLPRLPAAESPPARGQFGCGARRHRRHSRLLRAERHPW